MRITERFDTFAPKLLRLKALQRQARALERELEAEDGFIKQWFRDRPDRRSYRGLAFSRTPFEHFDRKKAAELLGPKVKQVIEERYRESLSVIADVKAKDEPRLKPVPDAKRAAS